jgi:hypothetical protein
MLKLTQERRNAYRNLVGNSVKKFALGRLRRRL